MGETISRGGPNLEATDIEEKQPTSQWRLDYFERKNNFWYVVRDERENPVRRIQGQQARLLRTNINCAKSKCYTRYDQCF